MDELVQFLGSACDRRVGSLHSVVRRHAEEPFLVLPVVGVVLHIELVLFQPSFVQNRDRGFVLRLRDHFLNSVRSFSVLWSISAIEVGSVFLEHRALGVCLAVMIHTVKLGCILFVLPRFSVHVLLRGVLGRGSKLGWLLGGFFAIEAGFVVPEARAL